MLRYLVGIDGTERGRKALEWAACRAERLGAELTLLSVVDMKGMGELGLSEEDARAALSDSLEEVAGSLKARYPGVRATPKVAFGRIVDELVDEADGHDLVVLGSHHGASIGEAVGGAKGLRVSVSTSTPTAVVPVDWSETAPSRGIVVGVGPDDVSEAAIDFGVEEALARGCDLRLVSAWGLPAWISRPAEAMGGGLAPVGAQFQRQLDERVQAFSSAMPELQVSGQAIEGPSPAHTLINASRDAAMLVMGTHSRAVLGRTLFGSVTHSVLLHLAVPTVVAPQPSA